MEENMTLDMAKAIMANPVEYSNEEIKKAVAVYNAELTKIQNDKTMDAKTKENTIEEYDQFFKAFFKAFEDINKHADELARPEVDFEKAKYDSLRLSQAYFRAATPTDERKAAVNRLNAAMLAKLQAMDKSQPIEDSELSAIEEFIGRTDDAEIKSELQNLVAELKSDYDYENGLNANPEDLISRDEKADEALRNIHLYDENGEPTEDFKDMGELVDRISFTDEKGDVNARKKEIVDKMFSAAKLDAHRESISDVDFLVKNDEERHRDLVDRIKDHFTHKVAAASVADQFREIRPDDVADEDSFEKYMEERDKAARAAMDNIVNSTSPINIKEKDAIIAVADSEVDTEKFVRRLEYRTKTDSKIKASWQKLREGAKRLWGQRYEFTRGVIKSIKDNKWQHITNVLATGAMWVTMSLNAHWAVPAIAGYAVYSAAGNYIWPVLRERKELCEKAKKEGKKLGFFASLKQAWKNKKDDKKFRIRGRFGLVAGATGAVLGLGGTLSAVSNALGLSGAVSSPAGVALMRKGLGLLRAAGGLSAQSMVLNWAKKDFKKDPSDKNRRELHNARLSFGVSLAGSLWASWLFGKNTFNDVAGNGVEGNGGSENDLGANDGGKGSPGGGNTTPAGPVVDLDSLTADEKSMYNNSILKFGGGDKARGIEVVKRYLDSFAAGNVDSLPKGMSPVQYIDAMNRLSQYHAHPEAVKLMFQDLDCPDFKPTAEQKEMIAKALQDIHYTRGMMDVIVFDECKNPRVMKAPMFGQYFGEQKYFTYVDPVSGQERVLPVRTLNYTGKVEGIVDCEKGATVLHGKIKYATLPCDKL
ncbi:MAG: hypothetical protein IJ529_05410, partial [Alphaproteobacteria bacterium]|nr:hypothetical protein [Alphaproteobacteria bacterium]